MILDNLTLSWPPYKWYQTSSTSKVIYYVQYMYMFPKIVIIKQVFYEIIINGIGNITQLLGRFTSPCCARARPPEEHVLSLVG